MWNFIIQPTHTRFPVYMHLPGYLEARGGIHTAISLNDVFWEQDKCSSKNESYIKYRTNGGLDFTGSFNFTIDGI